MPQNRSRYEYQQEASLSQQLAHKHPEYQELAGSDYKISKKIARIKTFVKFGLVDGDDWTIKLLLAVLNEDRKAAFATSERVNEITKMGLQMPKAIKQFGDKDDDEE